MNRCRTFAAAALSETTWTSQFLPGARQVGGLLGTAGSIIVTSAAAAGVLFITASVISFSTLVPTVLFIIAAVYALCRSPPCRR